MHSAIDISRLPAADVVDSFVVLAPSGAEYRSPAALREVELFLKGCFPKVDFYASGDALPFDGDYKVLPVCGDAGDDSDILRKFVYPDRALMLGIAAALKGFLPGHRPTLH